MSGPSPPKAPTPPQATTSFVVGREKFDSVPRKRALYIGLYVISFIFWLCLAFHYLRLAAGSPPPDQAVAASTPGPAALPTWAHIIRVLTALFIALFYIPFISVLRTMGYPWIAIFAFCGFALAPIPGLLIVAYIDTRIAKAWGNAELKLNDANSTVGDG